MIEIPAEAGPNRRSSQSAKQKKPKHNPTNTPKQEKRKKKRGNKKRTNPLLNLFLSFPFLPSESSRTTASMPTVQGQGSVTTSTGLTSPPQTNSGLEECHHATGVLGLTVMIFASQAGERGSTPRVRSNFGIHRVDVPFFFFFLPLPPSFLFSQL